MRRNYTHTRTRGFTLIELMIAMVFVAFILIFMSLTLVQMLRTYDKAIAMKQINQAGRSITEDIARSMRAQLADSIKLGEVGRGVLCIDKTMYYWNPLYSGGTKLSNSNASANMSVVSNPTANNGMMVRRTLKTPTTDCTLDNAQNHPEVFESGTESIILTERSRVVWANVTPVSTIKNKLFQITFIIGTYDKSEFDSPSKLFRYNSVNNFSSFTTTPHREISGANASVTCLPGTPGNYCSFAEFSTIVYVSGDAE